MVTTAENKFQLDTNEWKNVLPEAACANRPKDIPSGDDTFTVQRSPKQAELMKLMPALDKAHVSKATRQAAVWIITDNADYNDLGILVVSQFGFGGSRAINENETAQAIKIVNDAGIDITHKMIWKDKQIVLNGLKDTDLRNWLKAKK
jgi:hypothetical protein